MIVIDVETGGLEPHKNPLLSIGAVEFEKPDNQFYIEIKPFDGLECNPKAMAVNGIDYDKQLATGMELYQAMQTFRDWLKFIPYPVLAGMNPSFDKEFLNVNFKRFRIGYFFNHRTIDLHSVAHAQFKKREIPFEDGKLYTDMIYKKLGMPDEPKPHNALNGAIYEAEAFSRLINNRRLGLIE